MKKIIYILALFLSVLGYSQDKSNSFPMNFYGEASEVKTNILQSDSTWTGWSEWQDVQGTILIYVDWAFGNVTVTNKNFARYILVNKFDEKAVNDSTYTVFVQCYNSFGLVNILHLTFSDESFLLKVLYSNVEYEYKIIRVQNGYPLDKKEKKTYGQNPVMAYVF